MTDIVYRPSESCSECIYYEKKWLGIADPVCDKSYKKCFHDVKGSYLYNEGTPIKCEEYREQTCKGKLYRQNFSF